MKNLFEKYDSPVPRYTSYPTVPYWCDSPTPTQWVSAVNSEAQSVNSSWALYIHLPFCETLCTFCGCNTVITKDHDRESQYVDLLLKEFETYARECASLLERPIRQIHLGGGTPTFFSPKSLDRLMSSLLQKLRVESGNFEASVEVDPRRTSREQLVVLRELGFSRVSMGVQDFDDEVQRIVNRIQPYEMTRSLTETSRKLGYDSINYDLIYGLPKQTLASFEPSVRKTIELNPDRIALYSFALVPWIKPAQRLFKDDEIPVGSEKRELYEMARRLLVGAGYLEVGMDHFAKSTDPLARAMKNKTLHRNFMGYTDHRTSVLVGLGVSAISETPTCFFQNEKVLPVYERKILTSTWAGFRGHILSEADKMRREQILKLMTQYELKLSAEDLTDVKNFLEEPWKDGLVEFESSLMRVTQIGMPFLRNICMAFDHRLRAKQPTTRSFSRL